jgi:hypothetical protein
MSQNLANMIYLVFSCRLIRKAIAENLKTEFIQGQLDEARHQLNVAIKNSRGEFYHGF